MTSGKKNITKAVDKQNILQCVDTVYREGE